MFADAGIVLTEEQVYRLGMYSEMLVQWNEKINLTAITDDEGIAVKHFIDCISQPLKFLSYKKVMNFIDKFKFNYDNEEKDKFNLEKEYKEIIEKEKVFEEYVNYGGIFSVLSIVGSKVLDNEIYEKIIVILTKK